MESIAPSFEPKFELSFLGIESETHRIVLDKHEFVYTFPNPDKLSQVGLSAAWRRDARKRHDSSIDEFLELTSLSAHLYLARDCLNRAASYATAIGKRDSVLSELRASVQHFTGAVKVREKIYEARPWLRSQSSSTR